VPPLGSARIRAYTPGQGMAFRGQAGYAAGTSALLVVVGIAVGRGDGIYVVVLFAASAAVGVALLRPRELVLWGVPALALMPAFVRIPSLGGPDLTPQRLLLLLCLAGVAVAVPNVDGRRLPQRFRLWASLFTAYVLGSALLLHGGHLTGVNRALAYSVESFLPLYLVFRIVRDRRDIDTLLNRIVVAVAVAAGVGIVEAVRHSYLLGEHDPFFVHPAERNGLLRVQGVFPHPLVLGVAVAIVLPLAANKALHGERRGRNLLASVVMATGLVLTQGRGPLIAAAVGLVVLACTMRHSRRLGVLAVVGTAIVVLAVSPWGVGAISKAVANPTSENGGFTVAYRQALLHDTYHYANHHFTGAGPGYGGSTRLLSYVGGHTTDLSVSVDNAFAKYLLELGWPGLLIFLAVLWIVLHATRVAARTDLDGAALLAGFAAMIVASLTVATFTWAQILLVFWALAGAAFWLARSGEVVDAVRRDDAADDGARGRW
jgi:hypothetical protein